MEEKVEKKKKAKKAKNPGGRRPDKVQIRQMSVEDINKVIYPNFEQDMAEVLDRLYFNPAVELIKKFETIETIFNAKKDTLTFAEINTYMKTYTAGIGALLPYVYSKKAVKHDVQKLEVQASYSDMLDHLNSKALENKGPEYVEDSIDGDWDSID
ncbi:hypothetical protein [Methylobacter sp. YRD-M1]|uniref:hypothetical protein n=1 Tax=Methylobacter sp. YRD-M1 TaxID=2911520 RepID=UPI00227B18D7|nr:hypothetical protein [Methylobacter sp. YRD-M1]WAK01858.1 hypothetical protein LZ558_18895 [Methylobacter sp. YRD-M1]